MLPTSSFLVSTTLCHTSDLKWFVSPADNPVQRPSAIASGIARWICTPKEFSLFDMLESCRFECVWTARNEPERGFGFKVWQLPEPNPPFRFSVQDERLWIWTEPNLASTPWVAFVNDCTHGSRPIWGLRDPPYTRVRSSCKPNIGVAFMPWFDTLAMRYVYLKPTFVDPCVAASLRLSAVELSWVVEWS
jgi:hypothetical protein